MKTIKLTDISSILGSATIEAQLEAAERSIDPIASPSLPEAISVLPFVGKRRDRRTGQLQDPLESLPRRRRAARDEANRPHPTQLVHQLRKLRD